MIWLYPLFIFLAVAQALIMRRLGLLWEFAHIPAPAWYSAWGIFWVGSVLHATDNLTYFNLVGLFSVCFLIIAWGFKTPKKSVRQQFKDVQNSFSVLLDTIENDGLLRFFR